MKARNAVLAAILAFGVSGCMEVEQVSSGQKQGRYQGKVDGKPWENDPLTVGSSSKWTKGDKLSWETQIKARNDGQNEYKRIGQ